MIDIIFYSALTLQKLARTRDYHFCWAERQVCPCNLNKYCTCHQNSTPKSKRNFDFYCSIIFEYVTRLICIWWDFSSDNQNGNEKKLSSAFLPQTPLERISQKSMCSCIWCKNSWYVHQKFCKEQFLVLKPLIRLGTPNTFIFSLQNWFFERNNSWIKFMLTHCIKVEKQEKCSCHWEWMQLSTESKLGTPQTVSCL